MAAAGNTQTLSDEVHFRFRQRRDAAGNGLLVDQMAVFVIAISVIQSQPPLHRTVQNKRAGPTEHIHLPNHRLSHVCVQVKPL